SPVEPSVYQKGPAIHRSTSRQFCTHGTKALQFNKIYLSYTGIDSIRAWLERLDRDLRLGSNSFNGSSSSMIIDDVTVQNSSLPLAQCEISTPPPSTIFNTIPIAPVPAGRLLLLHFAPA